MGQVVHRTEVGAGLEAGVAEGGHHEPVGVAAGKGQLVDQAVGQARHLGENVRGRHRRSGSRGGVAHRGVATRTASGTVGVQPPVACSPAGTRRAGSAGDLPGPDLLVQGQDGVQQCLGGRRAPGGVDVDRHDLVDSLDDGVVVEHAAGRGADAHGDDPLGLHHLVVDLAQHRGHLLGDPPGHDHEVGLAGRGPEDLHAQPADVVVGGPDRHHLNGTAGQAEGGGPHAVAPGPLDHVLEATGQEIVLEVLEAHRSGRLTRGFGRAALMRVMVDSEVRLRHARLQASSPGPR